MSTFIYPPSAAAGSNPSVGTNNDPIPASSTLIAAENPSGDLTPLQVSASGDLLVEINSETSGLATSSNQATQITEAQSTNTKLDTLNAKDFATQTTLAALNAKVTAVNTGAVVVSSSALPTGAATAANQVTANNSLSSIETSTQDTVTSVLLITDIGGSTDQIDNAVGPLLDASVNNIPASSSPPLQIVASLAFNTYLITSVDDIGEFIGLYTGAPSSEVLHAILPLGGGDTKVSFAAGTRISIRNMKNAAITSGNIAINFLGA